ncbi:MAG: hypothetical protein ACRC6O_13280 [Flavobacterium sp.]
MVKKIELWNLDQTIISFVLPRLKAFKKMKRCGHPASLSSQEEWEGILDKMIFAFIEYKKEFIYKKMTTEEFRDYENKIKEGFELFGKYLRGLWD